MKQIKDIAKQYIIEEGKETAHTLRKKINAAVKIVSEMHYDVTGVPVSELVSVSNNKQILIPDGMIKLDSISLNVNGWKTTLTESADIALNRNTDNCGTPTGATNNDVIANGIFTSDVVHNNAHGENIGRYYGVNSTPAAGQYVIDYEKNIIQLSPSTSATQVQLTYLIDITRVNGKLMVNPMMEECILAGMEWILNRRKSRNVLSRGAINDLQTKYVNAKYAYIARMQPTITKQTAISLARSGKKQSKF